ncbi:MAG: translation initiation factor Sui1 [Candidatus Eisenbacteria bacterium]
MDRSRLVYSTREGKICPDCGKPVASCACPRGRKAARPAPQHAAGAGDGVARVRREVKGRGGKTVTTISGLPLGDGDLAALAADLKRRFGTGGSHKDGIIVIQGDHADEIVAELERRGHRAKRAGG